MERSGRNSAATSSSTATGTVIARALDWIRKEQYLEYVTRRRAPPKKVLDGIYHQASPAMPGLYSNQQA